MVSNVSFPTPTMIIDKGKLEALTIVEIVASMSVIAPVMRENPVANNHCQHLFTGMRLPLSLTICNHEQYCVHALLRGDVTLTRFSSSTDHLVKQHLKD